MELVIFDTEFTTWEGAQERRWQGENEYKEIIQIGAIKVRWPEADVVDRMTLYVKPKLNPVLSDYCKQLVGIEQDVIDNQGVPFQEALAVFLNFCETNLTLSFGHDASILAENILLNNADPLNFYGHNSPSFLDIKYWFFLANKTLPTVSAGTLWQHFGNVPPENFRHEHHPLSDCYSILQALNYLRQTGAQLPF